MNDHERRKSGQLKGAIWWTKDKARMVQWLIAAIMLYTAAMMVTQPQIQTALWKR